MARLAGGGGCVIVVVLWLVSGAWVVSGKRGSGGYTPCRPSLVSERCKCSYGPNDRRCSRCKISGDEVCKTEDTCWDATLKERDCVRTYIEGGQLYTKSDCCANGTLANFDSAKDVLSVGGATFVKDTITKRFVPYTASALPIEPFPGLAAVFRASVGRTTQYDNYTCAGRCCRKALVRVNVSEVPKCSSTTDDWRSCVQFGPNAYALCVNRFVAAEQQGVAASAAPPCNVWIPCEDNDGADSTMLIAVFGCVSLLIWAAVAVRWCCWERKLCTDVGVDIFVLVPWLAFFINCLLNAAAVRAASDVAYWIEHTEVDLAYASYQACVEACNGFAYPSVVRDKFCADDYEANDLAIWEADRNPIAYEGGGSEPCPTGVGPYGYCRRCEDHANDWVILRDAASALRNRVYAEWGLYAGIFLLDLGVRRGFRFRCNVHLFKVIALASIILHFTFMIITADFAFRLRVSFGTQVMDKFTHAALGQHLSLCMLCEWSAPMDAIALLIWVLLMYKLISDGYWNDSLENHVLPPTSVKVQHNGETFADIHRAADVTDTPQDRRPDYAVAEMSPLLPATVRLGTPVQHHTKAAYHCTPELNTSSFL